MGRDQRSGVGGGEREEKTILLPLLIASIFFQECFVAENLRQAGRYAEKNSITLTPRSSTCLLRNTKPGTLYKTRALLTSLIFLEVPN